ncbi:hypothetical protein WME99_02350 [Sorangium sp. So ce136]|uniref:hypothetical protein n=1 Tax=Sorangium sp. So ce136 TaxID=3133284 RepID=UPI003F0A3A66
MPCHRVIALASLAALFAVAGCEADPGTVNLLPNYITVSSSSSGGGGDVGTTTSVSVTTTSAGGEGGAGGVACTCEEGLSCCGPTCVNLANDPHNCGTCGTTCAAEQACIQGECKDPCAPEFGCEEGICCGEACCTDGTLCCDYGTSAEMPLLLCQDPVNGTCPVACSGCEN